MSYAARVARIAVRPHPNADRLQLGTCLGYQVVVGLEVQNGELGILFPADGQLSKEYCEANDLIARVDEEGNRAGGFFDEKRRVRAQKFRGEKSEAYWAPITEIYKMARRYGADVTVLPDINEGDSLTEYHGTPLCQRYETTSTRIRKNNVVGVARRGETPQFRKHFDTDQLRFHANSIPADALIIITEKLHGTSHRVGRVVDEVEQPLPVRLWNRFAPKSWRIPARRVWSILHGSRNVILDELVDDGFHGGDFRQRATAGFVDKLRKGEVVYGEIVGYTGRGQQTIMAAQDLGKLRDKELSKRYSSPMVYAYGCAPGECKFFAYRIVQTTEDGDQVELSWAAVKKRCSELGVEHVPEIDTARFDRKLSRDLVSYSGHEALVAWCDEWAEGPSTLDAAHLREGVCVRVESAAGTKVYKHKSFTFGVLEGYIKDNDQVIDIEEAS